MKKLSLLLSATFCLCTFLAKTQNVGINNTNPQAALDLSGDLRLRSVNLSAVIQGLNLDVDITTTKSSVYMFNPAHLAIQIGGFNGGVDGRVITIFNNTSGAIQLYNEFASSTAANRILTGTGNAAIIYGNGSVTLRYDGAKLRWTIVSSNFTDGLSSNIWNTTGNAGTTASNFIGTTDAQPLQFKINNKPFGFFATNNAAIGDSALYNNTTGFSNIALGNKALFKNTDRSNLVAIGDSALYNNGLGAYLYYQGEGNTGVGSKALFANTIGFQNTAIGELTLYSNTIGINNTSIGSKALYNNTTGNNNTANGSYALYFNTNGYHNTANGAYALLLNTTGYANTANGSSALESNTTGYGNTANGYYGLISNTTGSHNTANGSVTLLFNTTGSYNTANGLAALHLNTTGSHNTANGNRSLYSNSTGNYNTAIGDSALYNNTVSNNTAVGSFSLAANATGANNVAVGYQSGLNSLSSFNTFVGVNAGFANNNGNNTCIGNNAYSTAANVTNYTAIGYNVGYSNSLSNYVELGNTSVTDIRANVISITAYSDKRIKDNVQDNVPGLSFITQLKPVTYNLNIHKQNEFLYNKQKPDTANWEGKYDIEKITQTGFLAQDVDATLQKLGINFSGLVKPKNDKDLYTIRYTDFIMPIVKGMQEQQVVIEDQNKKIEDLQQENIATKKDTQTQLQNLQQQINELKKLLTPTVKN